MTLHLHTPNWVPLDVPVRPLKPGQVLDLGRVTMKRGLGLRGFVRDPKGSFVSGAAISVSSLDRTRDALGQMLAETDERGCFLLQGLRPGSYLVVCRADGYPTEKKRLSLEKDPVTNIQFELKPGAIFDGMIVNDVGEPVSKARVAIFNDGATVRAISASDGRFHLTGAPSEEVGMEVGMEVWHHDYQKFSVRAATPKDLPTKVALQPAASLEVSLVSAGKTDLPREVEYHLVSRDSSWTNRMVLANGKGTGSGLKTGRFELKIFADGRLLFGPKIIELVGKQTMSVEVSVP